MIIKNGEGIIELKVFNGYIEKKIKNEYLNSFKLHFRCGMTNLNYSLKKLGKTFKLQKELLKTEMNHNEVAGDNYKDKINEWLPYVENDVLCTAFSYARYIKAMDEITGFSMKDCLSLPGLGLKYLNSLRTEEEESVYTYNDKYMKHFAQQAAYGGRVSAFNRYYKSKHCGDILKLINEELCVKRNVNGIVEAYMDYKNKHFKVFAKEYESQFNDYRHENFEAKEKYINEKLSEFPIHKLKKKSIKNN